MDRDQLEAWIRDGLSLAAMGDRAGRNASTVAYWLERYGLEPVHRVRHMPRGSLSRERLEELIARELSIRAIAAEVERSPATVRYWMRRYGLSTLPAVRRGQPRTAPRRMDVCAVHGLTEFVGRADGRGRCARCRAAAVSRWRREAKAILVAEAGGCCRVCGYDRCIGALEFHHVDPREKSFSLSSRGLARSIEALRDEAAKCVLVCSNCHAEIENGARSCVDFVARPP